MGSGAYDSNTFRTYASTKGLSYDSTTSKLGKNVSHQDIFKSYTLDKSLNPKGVIRECCDTPEHPNTLPVILALDVTGSMGDAATEAASSLGVIMTGLYDKVKDVEFMTMGIGDFAYDDYPLQVSQFESDIRINEQLDKMYFEFGGGDNSFESYTAAWKFGLDHTKLDCYDKRGQKGIIITLGDELINPYINKHKWYKYMGESLQADIDTKELYKEASKKFDIYHINVDHRYYGNRSYDDENAKLARSFGDVIGIQHVYTCKIADLDKTITNIVLDAARNSGNKIGWGVNNTEDIPVVKQTNEVTKDENGAISW